MYIKILHFTLSPISCQGVSDIKGSPEIVDVARPQSTRSSNSTRLSSRKSLSLSGLTIADLHRRNFLKIFIFKQFFHFRKSGCTCNSRVKSFFYSFKEPKIYFTDKLNFMNNIPFVNLNNKAYNDLTMNYFIAQSKSYLNCFNFSALKNNFLKKIHCIQSNRH